MEVNGLYFQRGCLKRSASYFFIRIPMENQCRLSDSQGLYFTFETASFFIAELVNVR